ncbi:hypothetical protein PENSPDRAFT_751278 [Peniophora sp. CONT]|nr:hypothetical protein PENSPDRAFT_751278 [Peniophora sp. CONT]
MASNVSIPQTAPAGSLTVTSPPQSTIAFFKIASNAPVTFAWSFTDVLSTPASLTVSAVCDNGMTFPVGPMTDGAIPGTATSVVWDLASFESAHPESPLPQSTYRLQINDERGQGVAIEPGLLTPYNALKFALYSPGVNSPLPTNGGGSSAPEPSLADQLHTSPAFVSVLATIMIMVLSGFALIRNGLH